MGRKPRIGDFRPAGRIVPCQLVEQPRADPLEQESVLEIPEIELGPDGSDTRALGSRDFSRSLLRDGAETLVGAVGSVGLVGSDALLEDEL